MTAEIGKWNLFTKLKITKTTFAKITIERKLVKSRGKRDEIVESGNSTSVPQRQNINKRSKGIQCNGLNSVDSLLNEIFENIYWLILNNCS